MVESRKSIPWNQFQDYLKLHDSQVKQITKLEENGIMSKALLETIIPESLRKIHSMLSDILSANHIALTPSQNHVDPQDSSFSNLERKDSIISNLEGNIEVLTNQLHELNAKLIATQQSHQQEIKQLEEKMVTKINEQKNEYEVKINELN